MDIKEIKKAKQMLDEALARIIAAQTIILHNCDGNLFEVDEFLAEAMPFIGKASMQTEFAIRNNLDEEFDL